MPFPALLLPLLAAAAPAPITVTGHAWAPFISPMGEPFRARTVTDDTLARWFAGADRNHDGVLTADELVADADRFFATLDADHSGEIDPDELAHYEYEVAPDVQVMSKTRRAPGDPAPKLSGKDSDDDHPPSRERRRQRDAQEASSLGLGGALQGAARYGLLNMPEPVAAADADFNRGISAEEFREAAIARFRLLDVSGHGRITLAQLQAGRTAALATKGRRGDPDKWVGTPLPAGN